MYNAQQGRHALKLFTGDDYDNDGDHDSHRRRQKFQNIWTPEWAFNDPLLEM
jgi:hypothetical protein